MLLGQNTRADFARPCPASTRVGCGKRLTDIGRRPCLSNGTVRSASRWVVSDAMSHRCDSVSGGPYATKEAYAGT